MPRNSSGTYTLPESAFVPGTTIQSAAVNSDFSDIATALTQSLATTGVSTMTGPIKAASGTAAAPGYAFGSDADTGFYLIAAGQLGITIAGTNVATVTASGFTFTTLTVTTLTATTLAWTTATGATLALSSTSTPLVITRTENDTSEHTALAIGSGSGAGNNYNLRIVGDGSNAVATYREYIGTTQINDVSASVSRSLINLGVGVAVSVNTSGWVDMTEITAPATAASNSVRLYAVDNGSGVSRLAYKDDAGNAFTLGAGQWETIFSTTVATSVTLVGMTLTKTYSELVGLGYALSVNAAGAGTNQFGLRVSDDAGATFATITGVAAFTASASVGVISLSTRCAGYHQTALGAATADVSVCVRVYTTGTTGVKNWQGQGSSPTEGVVCQGEGYTTSIGAVNYAAFGWTAGAVDAGTVTLLGRLA